MGIGVFGDELVKEVDKNSKRNCSRNPDEVSIIVK